MTNHGRTTPTREQQAINADQGWRKRLDGLAGLAAELIGLLDDQGVTVRAEGGASVSAADVVRRLLHLIDSRDGNVRADERAAWDAFAAAAFGTSRVLAHEAAACADSLLAERRKRFGGGT